MDEPSPFQIGVRTVGGGAPYLLVAEVAQAHDGSLGLAHAFIDAVADAGADAVKFQTHIAAAESSPREPFRVPMGGQDASRYDYWVRTGFTEAQWLALAEHARTRGLLFLSSPFSLEAVEWLSRIGVPAWKIASGQISDVPVFERVAATGLPILLSTGMSPLEEIDRAVARVRAHRLPLLVFQTTSVYPTPPEQVGLNMLETFRGRYGCPVGLSDHSGTIWPGLAAAALGADMVEVHVTLSREMFGPDLPASVTTAELRQLADGLRWMCRMRHHPVDKDRVARELEDLRQMFMKSVVVLADLPAGSTLAAEHLSLRKPGTGLTPERLPGLVGRRLRRAVRSLEVLQAEDVE